MKTKLSLLYLTKTSTYPGEHGTMFGTPARYPGKNQGRYSEIVQQEMQLQQQYDWA